jgi:dTMP kinase
MDDHSGVAVLPELWNALRGRSQLRRPRHTGLFLALEGADAAARSQQLEALRGWLADAGREVVVVAAPTLAAPLTATLRELEGDPGGALSPRAEALVAAAVRAEQVSRVIEPALARGAVVLTDRYVDSTVARQSAAGCADLDELSQLAQWATRSVLPDMTILLDADPAGTSPSGQHPTTASNGAPFDVTAVNGGPHDAAAANGGQPSIATRSRTLGPRRSRTTPTFDERVRAAFLQLADEEPHRYLVLDATAPAEVLDGRIRQAVGRRLTERTPGQSVDSGAADEDVDPAGELMAAGHNAVRPERRGRADRRGRAGRRGGADRRTGDADRRTGGADRAAERTGDA